MALTLFIITFMGDNPVLTRQNQNFGKEITKQNRENAMSNPKLKSKGWIKAKGTAVYIFQLSISVPLFFQVPCCSFSLKRPPLHHPPSYGRNGMSSSC